MKLQQWSRRMLKRLPLVRQVVHWRQSAALKKQSPEEIFTHIYRNNTWGSEASFSGTGSDEQQTQGIAAELPKLFAEFGIQSMLDVPCGDFHWMKSVDLQGVAYIGGDIVEEMIAKNDRYRTPGIFFIKLNLLADQLPKADLVFCRDCLVHFSFDDVLKALRNIAASGSKYLLTTTFTARNENRSIATGQWRPLNLQCEPIGLPPPLKLIVEGCTELDGEFPDKSLGLWKIDDIRDCVAKVGAEAHSQ
jgi:hypothetical protein